MKVRSITETDIEPLIELGKHMHASSPVYSKYPFDEPTLRRWLFLAIETPEQGFCAVAEADDGKLAGVFLACCGPMLISQCKVAYEQTLFVYERFRGTKAAVLLESAFDRWARESCVAADVGVSAGINDEAAMRFYRRRGYKEFGVVFRKELR